MGQKEVWRRRKGWKETRRKTWSWKGENI